MTTIKPPVFPPMDRRGTNDFGIDGKRYHGEYVIKKDGQVKLELTEITDKEDKTKISCTTDKDKFNDFYRNHLIMYNNAQANYSKAMHNVA